jgi:hypothetical protein
MNNKIILLLVVCIAVVLAAGCTGIPGGKSDSVSFPQNTVPVTDSNGLLKAESKIAYGEAGTPVPASTPVDSGATTLTTDTKIIKTAILTIEVKDVPGSVEFLKDLATQKGGYLSSTNIQKNFNNRLTGTVIIRVPAKEFETTLTGVQEIGTVKSVSTQGQDVTEEYVDLQVQKTAYQNQLAQYNEIMKKAVKVEDVITVQQQIDRVQVQLNRFEGRLKYLDSRIDLSTITVNLQEPDPVGGQSAHNFVSTINDGISGFYGMIDALIIIFLTLLPIIIIGGAGYGIYYWHKERKGTDLKKEPEKEKERK